VWANQGFPGTTITSRPCSSASLAVISAPLRSGASATITPRDKPLTIRFRSGNRRGRGNDPGGYSEKIAPFSRISSRSSACSRGYATSTPHPRTATVVPPAWRAPLWAAASIPRAIPLTTVHRAAASSPDRMRANSRPGPVGARLPTTATASPPVHPFPARYRRSGAPGISRSATG
jgi:hypothetical protein